MSDDLIPIIFRSGTAASAAASNRVLDASEPGYETDTGRMKIGDGQTAWNDLPYFGAGGAVVPPTRTVTAGVAIGGHRAVYVADDGKLYPCQPDLTARRCIGITSGAVAQGAAATVQIDGAVDEPSWSWAGAEPVWLAADGTLTQATPTAGALCQVGTPIGPTTLRIEPHFYALT